MKWYRYSSIYSLSYTAPSFNSRYEPLTLSFDSDITVSRVSGIDDKVSAYADKVVSKLDHY